MKKCFLTSVLLLSALSFLSAYNINEIEISPAYSGAQIAIGTDRLGSYRDYQSGDNIVIDFYGATNNLRAAAFPYVDRGPVVGIGIADFSSSDIIRVVIETSGLKSYKVSSSGSNLIINVEPVVSSGSFSVWRASESIQNLEYSDFSFGGLPSGSFVGSGGLISMNLDQADITTVLRAIADYSGRDIIAAPTIAGTVTLRLNNVTWWQALQAICHSHGLGISEENGILLVGTQGDFDTWRQAQESAERVIYRVYTLQYSTPSEVSASISSMISEKGSILLDLRTNSVIVSDIESRQSAIKDMIDLLDKPTPQVEIVAKIVDMNMDASRSLGINWRVLGLGIFDENEIQFGDTSQTYGSGLINLSFGQIYDYAQINASLVAMESKGDAKTIASPHVTVLDNNPASILGGKRFGVPVRGSDGSVTIQFYDAGTRLEVTPHVNANDEITLEIRTELSDVDVASVQEGKPIITTHEASTNQRVMDGETVVLGGFVTESENQNESGIPILKSIPIIGWLFKTRSTSTTQREVLIFITPHIIRPHLTPATIQ
ncbi:AMIN domain-containing protein [candidate division WOR-3 bacterium]|nr:AMIN domain-containing protein [candidate division WOR-3 bacterium]